MVFISHTSGMPSHTSGTFLYVIDRFDSVPPCLSDICGDPVYQASLISGMQDIEMLYDMKNMSYIKSF